MIVRNEDPQKKPDTLKTLAAMTMGLACCLISVVTWATTIADVRSAAEQHVLARLQDSSLLNDAQEYTVEVGQLDSRLQVGDCNQPLQAVVHGQWPSSQPLVKISCMGSTNWSMYVPVTVSVFHMVATAASAVERGQIINGSAIAMQKQNIMATHGRYYRSVEEAAGQIAKRHLSPGELLGAHNLDMPKAIKRGDDVVISASTGAIAVKMPAVAMSDGRVGQRISVKNSSSQRIIQATVVGPGVVAIAM